jgi:MFS family permease
MHSQATIALAFPGYRQFAVALFASSIGAQLLNVATLWQVYQLTGSPLLLGLTGLTRAVPHMILALVGGIVADRVDRARLIQLTQLANGVLVLALAALTITGQVQIWHLFAATSLNSAFMAISLPARGALVPRLVPEHALVNAVALNSTLMNTAQIVGPALGGVVIGSLDLGATYLLNGGAYLVAMLALIGVQAPGTRTMAAESPWRSFVQGLVYVRQTPVIIALMSIDMSATVLGSYRALLPIIADGLGVGPQGFGLLSAAPGVGSVLAASVLLGLGDMRYKGLYTAFGVLAYCLALILLAVSPWLTLSLVASGLLGATDTIQMIPRNSAILSMTPDALRGRVEAFRTMLSGGGPSLGYTSSGALASLFGAPIALLLGAVACAAVVAGITATSRGLRAPNLGAAQPEPSAQR